MLFFRRLLMDNQNIRKLVKIYVSEKYPKSAEQISKRLNDIICIFERHGVTDPTDADFENIIKPEITATKGKKGKPASLNTVEAYLGTGKVFYEWLNKRGDNRMTENEINNVEEQSAVIDMAQTDTPPSINQEAKNEQPQNTERRVGKPVTTGRSEKISLYLTKETYRQLEALRIYDEIDLQDLLNEAIQVYFETRADDLEFLQRQAQARQERKARKLSQ